jgi:hypothetical protein
MKKALMILVLLAIATGGTAMIETLSLEQLAHQSDAVVFATVIAIKSTEKTPEGVRVIANLVQVSESLKGELKPEEKIKIKTFAGVEDNVTFNEQQKYLLFLQKADGFYNITNAIQGCWPVEADGKFSKMGSGISLKEVKEAINTKPLQPQFKVPDLQL